MPLFGAFGSMISKAAKTGERVEASLNNRWYIMLVQRNRRRRSNVAKRKFRNGYRQECDVHGPQQQY